MDADTDWEGDGYGSGFGDGYNYNRWDNRNYNYWRNRSYDGYYGYRPYSYAPSPCCASTSGRYTKSYKMCHIRWDKALLLK